MRGRRRGCGGGTLGSAFLACSRFAELREPGRKAIDAIVIEAGGDIHKIADRFQCSVRHARRALAAYGWTNPNNNQPQRTE